MVRATLANTAAPHLRPALLRLLLARNADGERVLGRAAAHRDTVDATMKAVFTSACLSFEDKRALLVRSLHLIGQDPCDCQTLLDAIVGALSYLDSLDAARLHHALHAVLPFVLRASATADETRFEAQLACGSITVCQTALVELLLSTGSDGLNCCVVPVKGHPLVHRLLQRAETAPLFLTLVLVLPGALRDWPRALKQVLFAKTSDGRTPLWTADIAEKEVTETVMSVVHFIVAHADLCTSAKRRLLLGFASPPAGAGRLEWALIQRAYARAFEADVADEADGVQLLELAMLRQFSRWNDLLTPAWTRQAVAQIVALHPLPSGVEAELLRRLSTQLDGLQASPIQPADSNSTA